MPSISMFENEKGDFVCPFCGTKISSRRRSTLEYIKMSGDHYSRCYKLATDAERSVVRHVNKVGF